MILQKILSYTTIALVALVPVYSLYAETELPDDIALPIGLTEEQEQNLLAEPVTNTKVLEDGTEISSLSLPNTPNQVAGTLTKNGEAVQFTSNTDASGTQQIVLTYTDGTTHSAVCNATTCEGDALVLDMANQLRTEFYVPVTDNNTSSTPGSTTSSNNSLLIILIVGGIAVVAGTIFALSKRKN